MTPHARRGRGTKLAALSIAALTSVAMLSTAGNAATPTAAKAKHALTTGKSEPAKKVTPRQVDLQVLALNDFHGQLEPSTSSSSGRINGVPAGGSEYLATHLESLRAEADTRGAHSVTVAAGDLIGATPLVSAAFYDEPTIEAMNLMGLDISSVGNHEFDQGWRELVRKQEGGCLDDGAEGRDNRNSCPGGKDFDGAAFQYLSANVFHEDTGKTVLPSVEIKKYDGVPVAFIGMTLENTPNIVTKAGVAGLRFTDEVETANRLAKRLYKAGVKSIVVLVHEGGYPADPTAYNSCPGISGPIVDINAGLSPKIDAVITGHTHQAYNCSLPDPAGSPRLVTSSASLGRLVTDINLKINSVSGEIDRASAIAENNIVTRDVPKSGAMTELIAQYKELVASIESKVIGNLADGTTAISRANDESGESPLGNLIADAQKADASTITGGRAPEIAFMNPGGIRADLAADADGNVTYGAAFSTQPFNNYVVSMDMTGAQILTLLEQQWSGVNQASPKVLQVSGIAYTWSKSAPAGAKVVPGTVEVNGEPIEPTRAYRVVANSFLSDGGDGFAAFAEATNKYFGGLDIDALAAYLGQNPGYAPKPTDRIDLASAP
jgi:5'-nucleotidase